MHDDDALTPSAARPRRFRTPLIAAAVILGCFAAGLGVSYAQTDPSTTTAPTATSSTTATTTAIGGKPFGHRRGPGRFGDKMFGFGKLGRFGGLHGEFTIRKPDGSGFQTWAVQTGEVTAVSPSSVTVKSEDGFSRTYSVDENSVVNSGRDGIGSVKTADTVRIAAVVENGNARAVTVVDSTSLGKIGEHWGFPKRK
ncbi:MAG TPA: hypothetical protein VEG38_14645 [Acidimicrobiia bacterium]|nr:hypothetical protein [Acidimicrobiia bacterium]